MRITDERAAELERRLPFLDYDTINVAIARACINDLLADRDEMLAEIERLKKAITESSVWKELEDSGKKLDDARADLARLAETVAVVAANLRKWSIRDGSNCMDKFADDLAAVVAEIKAREGE